MSGQQYPQRVKTALDDSKLKLFGDAFEGTAGQKPSLSIYYKDNNPRIDVYTNVVNDKDKGLIRAAIHVRKLMEMYVIGMMLASDHTEKCYVIDIEDNPWIQAEKRRSKDPVVVARILMGRDKEGEMFISLLSNDNSRPKIRFPFRDSPYGKISIRGGTISKAELSTIVGQGYIQGVKDLYVAIAAADYVHPEPKPQGGAGGGGYGGGNGGGNRGGGGGGYKAPAAGADEDDLPFD